MEITVKSTVTADQEFIKLLEDALRVYLERLFGKPGNPLLPTFGRDKRKLASDVRKVLDTLAATNMPIDPSKDLVAHAEQEAAKEQAAEPPPTTSQGEPKKKKSKPKGKAAAPPPEEPKASEPEPASTPPPEEPPPAPKCPHCRTDRCKHLTKAPRGHVWQCQAPGCKMQFLTPHQPEEPASAAQTNGEELSERRKAFCKKCGDELELIGYDNEDDQTGIWACAACGEGNIRLSRWISSEEAKQPTA